MSTKVRVVFYNDIRSCRNGLFTLRVWYTCFASIPYGITVYHIVSAIFHCIYFLVGSTPHQNFALASFLLPLYSVTLDPIRFWVQRCFYILFPDRLTRHLFQPHFPGEAPNRTYAPGHLLFKLNRTSQSRHIFQTLLAE